MLPILTSLALIAGVQALVSREGPCCFHLTANGGPGGGVGQLADGQNRIGQDLPEALYCIGPKGGLTDQDGRGCILTPPTTQFQCDSGTAPLQGFAIGCNGTLELNGNTAFAVCPTGDNGGYNIYTSAPAGQNGCESVTLIADECMSGCPASSSSPAASATATPAALVSSCPTDLSGTFEYPHLIVPISSDTPTIPSGTAYTGSISSSVSSIFNFDIPPAYAGDTCSLVFLFPLQSQLETSSFSISGGGGANFSLLEGPATATTTYANTSAVMTAYGTRELVPGNAYAVATFDCPAGESLGVQMSAVGGTEFTWFQDYNPSPIGLYITVC